MSNQSGSDSTGLYVQVAELRSGFKDLTRRLVNVEQTMHDLQAHCAVCGPDLKGEIVKHQQEHAIERARGQGVAALLRASGAALAILSGVAASVATAVTVLLGKAGG